MQILLNIFIGSKHAQIHVQWEYERNALTNDDTLNIYFALVATIMKVNHRMVYIQSQWMNIYAIRFMPIHTFQILMHNIMTTYTQQKLYTQSIRKSTIHTDREDVKEISSRHSKCIRSFSFTRLFAAHNHIDSNVCVIHILICWFFFFYFLSLSLFFFFSSLGSIYYTHRYFSSVFKSWKQYTHMYSQILSMIIVLGSMKSVLFLNSRRQLTERMQARSVCILFISVLLFLSYFYWEKNKK